MVRLGIDMQLLSDVTVTAPADVHASNEHGASVVRRYPSRFGLLAALPRSDVDAALAEIEYAHEHLRPMGSRCAPPTTATSSAPNGSARYGGRLTRSGPELAVRDSGS
jgi:predicted TIM-barrel fold metal-dependent hydrolase